ncbi:MAG: hypothetical protein ACK2T4_13300 [Candidatus Promineifilaceae bacterium]|jgi:hypothetical protein
MSAYFLPLILAVGGLIAAFMTYRGIRRGGARYYTLEREAMLRRAMLTLLVSALLFISSVGLLIYRDQQASQDLQVEPSADGEGVVVATITPTVFVEQFPPTATATSSVIQPTATATPVICRAIVEGTSGNGLTLRDVPGGEEVSILPDGSVLTVLEDEPMESGGFTWRKVRLVGGDEGWVAEEFLTIRAPCD